MFNEKAAQWARELVMKMDPDEAAVLVPMVMSDVFYADVHNNKRAINGNIARIHKSMADDLDHLVSKGMMDPQVANDALVEGLGSLLVRDEEPLVEFAKYEYARDKSGKFAATDTLGARGKKKNRNRGRKRFDEYSSYAPTHGATDLATALQNGSKKDNRFAQAANVVDNDRSAFSEQWSRSARNGSSNAQTYNRLQAGGQALGSIGAVTGNQQLQLAGAMGNFAGQYGPEAEKVIGPSVRRAAYRYRGVTKKPDKELEGRVVEVLRTTKPGTELTNEDRKNAARQGVMQYLVGYRDSEGTHKGRIPSMQLAEIQRKSGRVTPSEGVMINPRGEVVAQAFGHADDHYVPFNLKQLSALNGGEYVRTRTTGGLTSEDIYTGLMAGATSVTVVSNSGVFTVDFAEDLKGVKRYGDKAQSMVNRYGKTLDTIRNGQIERVTVTPEVRAELLDVAEEERPPGVFTRKEIQERYDELLDEYKTTPSLTNGEMEDIENLARRDVQERPNATEKDYRQARAARIEQAMEAKSTRLYRLDGDGYSTALEAMKEQYPYFINDVKYTSSTKQRNAEGVIDTSRRAKTTDEAIRNEQYKQGVGSRLTSQQDKGYVKPKHNRPEDVLDGYYDSSIDGPSPDAGAVKGDRPHGKVRADRTDYQNWSNNPLNESAPKSQPKADEGESPKKSTPTTEAQQKKATQAWERQNNAQAAAAAMEAIRNIPVAQVKKLGEGQFPLLASMPAMLSEKQEWAAQVAADPKKRRQLADEAETFIGDNAQDASLQDSVSNAAKALRGTIAPSNSYEGKTFSERGHQPGASAEAREAARKQAEAMAKPLKEFFGDDTAAALKYVSQLNNGAAPSQVPGMAPDKADRLDRMAENDSSKVVLQRAGEGMARLQHLKFMGSGRESETESSPLTSAAPSVSPASASTAQQTPTTSSPKVEAPAPTVTEAPKKPTFEHAMKQLDKVVGQESIKREVKTMANYLEVQRARKELGLPTDNVGGHMVFLGNPGTGKTTTARIIGELYAAAGLLPSGHVVEASRADLVAEYAGQTAPRVKEAVEEAKGGVLFIDEAYTLSQDQYGQEAIDTLMQEMENNRGNLVVIAAGYDKNMDKFLSSNPGLRSRFNSNIAFEDYKPEELGQIFAGMVKRDGYELDEEAQKQLVSDMKFMHSNKDASFANGRTVRQYWENAKKSHANRVLNGDEEMELTKDDLVTITADDIAQPRVKAPQK